MFEGAPAKALQLPALYADVARRHGAGFVNAGDFIHWSPLDGIHFEADQHAILGRVMAEASRMVLA